MLRASSIAPTSAISTNEYIQISALSPFLVRVSGALYRHSLARLSPSCASIFRLLLVVAASDSTQCRPDGRASRQERLYYIRDHGRSNRATAPAAPGWPGARTGRWTTAGG